MELLQSPSGKSCQMSSGVGARARAFAAHACVGFIAVAAMFLIQVGFYENNAFHIPIVLDFAASAEGPHDAFHRSLDRFVSLFWLALRSFATEANLEPLFVGAILLNAILTAVAAHALVTVTGAATLPALVGTGIVVFAFADRFVLRFGGGELIASALTHSQAATALALVAVALAARGRWTGAALACGLAANLNLYLAFWSGGLVVVARLLQDGAVGWSMLRAAAKLGLLILVPALPALFWALQASPTAAIDFSFKQYLLDYFPHHNFVHVQMAEFLGFLCFVGAALMALSPGLPRADAALSPLRRLVVAAMAVLAIAALYPYLTDNRMLLNLYGLRFAGIVFWLAAAALVAWWTILCADRPDWAGLGGVALVGLMLESPAVSTLALALVVAEGRRRPQRLVLVLLAAVAVTMQPFGTIRDAPPAIAAACFATACLLTTRPPRGDRWSAAALASLLAVLAVLPRAPPGLLAGASLACVPLAALAWSEGAAWRRHVMILAAVAVALLALAWIASPGRDIIVAVGLGLAIAPLVAVAVLPLPRIGPVLVLGTLLTVLVLAGIGEGARHGFGMARKPADRALREAQAWARHNTPAGTLFYAPDAGAFTALARRPVWWSWKEGAAVMWAPDFYAQWQSRRLQAAQATSLDAIAELARREGIAYLLMATKKLPPTVPGGLEPVFQNQDYQIFAVRP